MSQPFRPTAGPLAWYGRFTNAVAELPEIIKAKPAGFERLIDSLVWNALEAIDLDAADAHDEVFEWFKPTVEYQQFLARLEAIIGVPVGSAHHAAIVLAAGILEQSFDEMPVGWRVRRLLEFNPAQYRALKFAGESIDVSRFRSWLNHEVKEAESNAKRSIDNDKSRIVVRDKQKHVVDFLAPPPDYQNFNLIALLEGGDVAEILETPEGLVFLWLSPSIEDLIYPGMRKEAIRMNRGEFTQWWFSSPLGTRTEIEHLFEASASEPKESFAIGQLKHCWSCEELISEIDRHKAKTLINRTKRELGSFEACSESEGFSPIADQSTSVSRFFSPTERAILDALDGKAMTKDQLKGALGGNIYRDGLAELRREGYVKNAKKGERKGFHGYYRPDRPPAPIVSV